MSSNQDKSPNPAPLQPRSEITGNLLMKSLPQYQRRAEDFFRRYVPRGMLRLLGATKITELDAGQHREYQGHVLFMDIRGFTSISERLNSEQTFYLLNRLFAHLIPLVSEHGGVIDKFIGDAIMAIFPTGPDQAVRAGSAMLQAVQLLQDDQFFGEHIQIGIGINSGFVIVGALGNFERMEVTVIGDTVNLASRIESLTKDYNVPFLINESTLNALENPGAFHIRMVDRIRVKGKLRPQTVYEIFDNDPPELRATKTADIKLFESALANYHLGNVRVANTMFEACATHSPDDAVVTFYLERCRKYSDSGLFEGQSQLEPRPVWSSRYLIHVDVIDEEHQKLFAIISELASMIWDQQKENLPSVLDELGKYADYHFEHEEQLMEQTHYPHMKEQIHEHRRFDEYFTSLRREIEAGTHDRFYLLFKIEIFLIDWLINHTMGVDRHLAHYLQERDREQQRRQPANPVAPPLGKNPD